MVKLKENVGKFFLRAISIAFTSYSQNALLRTA